MGKRPTLTTLLNHLQPKNVLEMKRVDKNKGLLTGETTNQNQTGRLH